MSKLIILRSGYGVTASIRSEAKVQQLLTINPTWKDKVHFGFVPELTAPNAFDKLFDKPYDFIVHTASPVAFKVNDVQKDLIDPAVEGWRSSYRTLFAQSCLMLLVERLVFYKPLTGWQGKLWSASYYLGALWPCWIRLKKTVFPEETTMRTTGILWVGHW